MENYLIDIIGGIGIFIICAQMLIHFRPKASYDKYLKMLVSAMILLQLFVPVSKLFVGKGEDTLDRRVEWFEEELARGMEEVTKRYEEQMTELQNAECYDSVEENVLGENNIQTGQHKGPGAVSVMPIPKINIQIKAGGAEDADISTGNP